MTPTAVRLWIDPSCPWAWQAFSWLRDVRDHGEIDLTYSFFSLEINAHALERNDVYPGVPYAEAAPRWGTALATLALARREGGNDAVERLLVAIGQARHGRGEPLAPDMLASAAVEAGLPGLPERARGDEGLEREILAEYAAARAIDVFGVPTLQIDENAVIYGPIIAVGPTGEDALALWREVKGIADRDAFFELKRWPRHLRPGEAPVGS
jgi:predicted DsbA family dithiol-disulfide isomerase